MAKQIQMQGTIIQFVGFDPEADSKKLRDAMKGLGTSEKAIIDILCYRSNVQRQEIRLKYKSMYGRDLVEDLKSELGANFEKVIVGLMRTPAEFDATTIKNAVKGVGTDEDALIEVICTRTNEELTAAKEVYKKLFKKEMEKAVASDVSGDFRRILVACLTANREPDGQVDRAKASKDAKDLFEAGEKYWGTDESTFNRIFAHRSYSHLRVVFDEYPKYSHHDVETAIKKELSGDLERAMLTIVKCVRSRYIYFADRLFNSMKGLGTDDETLIRVMVSRSEKDLVQIKTAFKDKYHKTLYSCIQNDTSGDYRRVLLLICRD